MLEASHTCHMCQCVSVFQYGEDALGSGIEDLESDTELIRVR